MRLTFAAALAALIPLATSTIYYAGVAESGGEFGVWSATQTPGTGLPGTFGQEYAFINEAAIDVSVDQNKINLFRVAFLLERMCPPSTGLGATFDETYFNHFKAAIDYITITKKAYAILDPHNYMRYNDPSSQPFSGSVIGNTTDPKAATTQQFAEFWAALAARFIYNERVIFGLMNEPHDMSSALLNENLQGAIDAIRKQGSRHLILAPGNNWSGGHAWTKYGAEGAALWMNKLVDPANNTAIDVHEYLDEDFSGGHTECKSDPVTNLEPLTKWLRENGLKAFITEFGGSNTTECVRMLGSMLEYMETNEEYIGWTAWAAGPFWGPYSPCCTDSRQLGSLEPGSKAGDGGPSLYDTVWLPVFQPKIPKKLHWNGYASANGGPLTER